MAIRSPEHAALGRALRELRDERGLSQEQVALESGLDRSYMSGIERGVRNPSYANLLRISETLDVNLSEWIGRAERLRPPQTSMV